MVELIDSSGFSGTEHIPLTFGVAGIYHGEAVKD